MGERRFLNAGFAINERIETEFFVTVTAFHLFCLFVTTAQVKFEPQVENREQRIMIPEFAVFEQKHRLYTSLH